MWSTWFAVCLCKQKTAYESRISDWSSDVCSSDLPDEDDHGNIKGGSSVMSAVKTILIADFVMSLDNVIAIAGAAQNTHLDHQLYYVIFGLVVRVPIIIWGSTIVLKLIDRFPIVVNLGAGLLGWIEIGGEL